MTALHHVRIGSLEKSHVRLKYALVVASGEQVPSLGVCSYLLQYNSQLYTYRAFDLCFLCIQMNRDTCTCSTHTCYLHLHNEVSHNIIEIQVQLNAYLLHLNCLCVSGENLLQGKTTLWIHAIQSAVVSITAAWAFILHILGPPNLYIPQRMRVPFMCR